LVAARLGALFFAAGLRLAAGLRFAAARFLAAGRFLAAARFLAAGFLAEGVDEPPLRVARPATLRTASDAELTAALARDPPEDSSWATRWRRPAISSRM